MGMGMGMEMGMALREHHTPKVLQLLQDICRAKRVWRHTRINVLPLRASAHTLAAPKASHAHAHERVLPCTLVFPDKPDAE